MRIKPTPLLAMAGISLAILLSKPSSASSQATAFTYQGRLLEAGAPVGGSQDFEFRLFDASSGGAQQGSTIPINDLAVSNGLFTATLDFGPAAFPGADRWLEIAVRPGASSGGYTTLSPRQPITAAPYAIAAGTVTGPIHGSAIVNGSISGTQIAAGAVTAMNLASNSVTASHLAAGSVTTSSLAGGSVSLDKLATTVAAAHCVQPGGWRGRLGSDRRRVRICG